MHTTGFKQQAQYSTKTLFFSVFKMRLSIKHTITQIAPTSPLFVFLSYFALKFTVGVIVPHIKES